MTQTERRTILIQRLRLVKDKDYFVITTNVDHCFKRRVLTRSGCFIPKGTTVCSSAAERYEDFLRTRKGQRILFLGLGVGYNTPAIIKYPFWRMTEQNPKATYACVNYGEAVCPSELQRQSICINRDIGEALSHLVMEKQ